MTETNQLLRDYSQNGSEPAFRELVGRYVDLVYSTALRRAGGDAQLAQDIVQTVFADLARKARSLPRDVMLGGWLHHHTIFVASNFLRGERRRQNRERQAIEMNALQENSDAVWKQLAPVLDEAIDRLSAPDRDAILLRFFEQRDLRAVGSALGISEDAAQKRVSRAIEKLRELVGSRGAISVVLLTTLLAAQSVISAPAGLAASASAMALAGAASAGGSALWKILTSFEIKFALGVAAVGIITASLILQHRDARPKSERNAAAGVQTNLSTPVADSAQEIADSTNQIVPEFAKSGVLHLTILAADTGEPVPDVQIDYTGWEKDKLTRRLLYGTRLGKCDIKFQLDTTALKFITQIDGFADTRLHWNIQNGEQIPTNYVLRLVRAVPIGGRVIDTAGQPVSGAKIRLYGGHDTTDEGSPEDHKFDSIEVSTDINGRWSINRITPEMINDQNFNGNVDAPAGYLSTGFGASAETKKQLLAGTYISQLGRPFQIRGIVVDMDGQPVAGAKVFSGGRGYPDSGQTNSLGDGTFTLGSSRSGKDILSAEAEGFATTTIDVDVNTNSEPLRLVLQRGKTLCLRVINQAGEPVKANVTFERFRSGLIKPTDLNRFAFVQADFNSETDADGRVAWTNAPDTELWLDIWASGYMALADFKIHPDGEEHVVTLLPAVVVSGSVRDAANDQIIPRFRLVYGWPWLPWDGSKNINWNASENFGSGEFHHSFEMPSITGITNPGYVLKIEAEGYTPFISRTIRPDEGEVRLDVKLHPETGALVTVLLPDGNVAARADVGLVSPGAQLHLVPGGFWWTTIHADGSLLSTDDNGQFRLPPDDTITRVFVANPAGYAEASISALNSDPTIRLQPWGRLEGTLTSGNKPAPEQSLGLQFEHPDYNSILLDFHTKTDNEGHFVFAQAPPIELALQQIILLSPNMQTGRSITNVAIRAGETTTVTIDRPNSPD
jgi:RNA polymerase sigma factor (sigma-70 family)